MVRAAAFAAAFVVCVPAFAQAPTTETSCASDYHQKLGEISARRGPMLAGLFPDLRAADTALPGRWLYLYDAKAEKSGRARTAPVKSQACVQFEGKGRRARCVATEERVAGSNEIAFAAAREAADLQAMRSLQDFVFKRGAVPEVGDNGKLTWLVQKLAQDLRSYVSQPAHPALCAGGREVAEFYGAQAGALDKRQLEVRAAVESARSKARERVQAFLALTIPASASKSGEAMTLRPIPVATSDAASVAAPAPVGAELASARQMLDAVTRAVLSDEQAGDVAGETTIFAAMRRAKPFLLDRQDAALTGEATAANAASGKAQNEALGRALMAVELLAYAELLDGRYDAVRQTLIVTPGEILKSHAASCGCAN